MDRIRGYRGYRFGIGLSVSTLVRWFFDKRVIAIGMVIMGFGGGAMVGATLANQLINDFVTETSVGVWLSFLVLAVIYFIFMIAGAMACRILPIGWKPSVSKTDSDHITTGEKHVHVSVACRTLQFSLLWVVLCLNVSAGIGILGMASPLLQEIFAKRLLGNGLTFTQLDAAQLAKIATIAAGFTGLLSLFNIGGRFFWASSSDLIGRKATFFLFFALGTALYALIPWFGQIHSVAFFVSAFCVVISMYGGGFATIPPYLADLFGTQVVGAIHGRLLTAWSAAGILGSVLVNYLREYQLSNRVDRASPSTKPLVIVSWIAVGVPLPWDACNVTTNCGDVYIKYARHQICP